MREFSSDRMAREYERIYKEAIAMGYKVTKSRVKLGLVII
jgi:hypothetical protein